LFVAVAGYPCVFVVVVVVSLPVLICSVGGYPPLLIGCGGGRLPWLIGCGGGLPFPLLVCFWLWPHSFASTKQISRV